MQDDVSFLGPQNITHKHNRQYSALPAIDSDQDDYDSDSLTDSQSETRTAPSRRLSDSSTASDHSSQNVTSVDGHAGSTGQGPVVRDPTKQGGPPIEAKNSRHSEKPGGEEEEENSATEVSVAQSRADEPQKKTKRPDGRNFEDYSAKPQIRSVEGGGNRLWLTELSTAIQEGFE